MEIGMTKAFASTTLFMESVSSERLLSCLLPSNCTYYFGAALGILANQLTGTATPSRHAMNGNIRHTTRIFGTAYHFLSPACFMCLHMT